MEGGSAEITDSALAFLSQYTKSNNLRELKEHVLRLKDDLQSKQLHVYKCIEFNMFLFPRIARHKDYDFVKKNFRSHYESNSSFKIADVGCCFGTDTRQLIVDGCRQEDIYSIDVHDGYWKFGLDLFRDTDTLKVNTLFTDCARKDLLTDYPDLSAKFNIIYTGAVLHVFAEDEVEMFLKNIYDMTAAGGTYIGSCGVGSDPVQTQVPTPKKDKMRYIHSTASLKLLLEKIGFVDVTFKQDEVPHDNTMIPQLKLSQFVEYSAKKP